MAARPSRLPAVRLVIKYRTLEFHFVPVPRAGSTSGPNSSVLSRDFLHNRRSVTKCGSFDSPTPVLFWGCNPGKALRLQIRKFTLRKHSYEVSWILGLKSP